MTRLMFLLFICWIPAASFSQITPPYVEDFDGDMQHPWQTSTNAGSTFWEKGKPVGTELDSTTSLPNAWVTNLQGSIAPNSEAVLISPAFDLSKPETTYVLSFSQKRSFDYACHGYIDYSLDGGSSWKMLSPAGSSQNWYASVEGYTNSSGNNFLYTTKSLSEVKGERNVKFRFRFISGNYTTKDGWLIDDFSVFEERYNLIATQGDTLKNLNKYFEKFTFEAAVQYNGPYNFPLSKLTTYLYFSKTPTLDASAVLVDSVVSSYIGHYTIRKDLSLPQGLHTGHYYVIYHTDARNNLKESNEEDNINYGVVELDTILEITSNTPYASSFEEEKNLWDTYFGSFNDRVPSIWEKGNNTLHQIYGTRFGDNSWFISKKPVTGGPSNSFSLESPYINLSSNPNSVLCFWYKTANLYSSMVNFKLEIAGNNGFPTTYSSNAYEIPDTRNYNWDCHCKSLDEFSSLTNFKFRFNFTSYAHYTEYADLVNIDDIYIGVPKPDLSLEHKNILYTIKHEVQDTLHYTLFNSGMAATPSSLSRFYWSADSLLDGSDQLFAEVKEDRMEPTSLLKKKLYYTKPSFSADTAYIIYTLDADNSIDEMREYDNKGVFMIVNKSAVALPYQNDFEREIDGWQQTTVLGSAKWEQSNSPDPLIPVFSGERALYFQQEVNSLSHLYTPVFDLSSLQNPVLEFNMHNLNVGSRYNEYAYSNLSYSVDGGASWHLLDTASQSFKSWYYQYNYDAEKAQDKLTSHRPAGLLFDNKQEKTFSSTNFYQSRDADRTTRFIIDISHLKNYPYVRFRFNVATMHKLNTHHILIDDFQVVEAHTNLQVIYDKKLLESPLSKRLKFYIDISNTGNYLAGSSTVSFFLSKGARLDESDVQLGEVRMAPIRPDMKQQLNLSFSLEGIDLSSYSYLAYKLDKNNEVAETDEEDNVGLWKLGTDTPALLPYYNDFEAAVIDGWHWYQEGSQLSEQRFRHKAAVGYEAAAYKAESGEWFLDSKYFTNVPPKSSIPFFYLESPNFDFSRLSGSSLFFDFICIGWRGHNPSSQSMGGNLQYSLDGGSTWHVLTESHDETAENWYEFAEVDFLDNEPGWVEHHQEFRTAKINLSLLEGEPSVKFRFKFKSTARPMVPMITGFRLDNFRIEGNTGPADLRLTYVEGEIRADINIQDSLEIPYTIINSGASAPESSTFFYLSDDAALSEQDSLILNLPTAPIAENSMFSSTVKIPVCLQADSLYLLGLADAEEAINEPDESNNLASTKIIFHKSDYMPAVPNYINIDELVREDQIYFEFDVKNNGKASGIPSLTKLYYSSDEQWNDSDSLIGTYQQEGIPSGSLGMASFAYPAASFIKDSPFYLFLKVDAENQMTEYHEDNNMAKILVKKSQPPLGTKAEQMAEIIVITKGTYIYLPAKFAEGSYNCSVFTLQGIEIMKRKVTLNQGKNYIKLEHPLAAQVYVLVISGRNRQQQFKIISF